MQTFFTVFTIACTLIALNYAALKIRNRLLNNGHEIVFAPILTGLASILMSFQSLESGFGFLDLRCIPIIMAGLRFGWGISFLSLLLPGSYFYLVSGNGSWPGIVFGLLLPAIFSSLFHRSEYRSSFSNIRLLDGIWICAILHIFQSGIGLFFSREWHWVGQSLFMCALSMSVVTVLIAMYNDENKAWLLQRQLELKANQDSLTLLPNLRSFMDIAGNMMKRRRISVLMIDIDNFKNYNDNLGHLQGDQLLREVGQVLRQTIGEKDYIARYGGEEFIVICHSCERSEVDKLAARICEMISTYPFAYRDIQPDSCISVSIGISTACSEGDDLNRLISEADQALYFSKNSGKNQYTVYEDMKLEIA
jgi:diguanylate cyclase